MSELAEEINSGKVREAVAKSKSDKASGPSGRRSEMPESSRGARGCSG